MSRGIAAFCIAATLALGAGSALAQPVLMPVHTVGEATTAEAQALAAAFVDEVVAVSEEPLSRIAAGPCPLPASCFDPGHSDSYWLQLSGDQDRRVAVAYRLDGLGDVASRAVARGRPGDERDLAATLAQAVAAGLVKELSVTTGGHRGAQVTLDGSIVGTTPYRSRQPIHSGFHLIQVRARDGRTAAGLVHASTGETAALDLELSAIPRVDKRRAGAWPLIPILASGAVAAILLATDPAGVIGPDYTLTIASP